MAKRQSAAPATKSLVLGLGALLVAAVVIGVVVSFLRKSPASEGATRGASSNVAAPSKPRIAIAAQARAAISGHVFDPAKGPVATATVCAWAPSGNGITSGEARAPKCTTTDATGAYSLTDLFPVAKLTLSAAAAKFPPEAYRSADGQDELRLTEGQQLTGIDFVLHAGGVAIKGRVNDATGGVVPGAFVIAEGQRGGRATASSDDKGEFAMWVDPGSQQISGTASGYAPGRASGPAPGHFFQIALMPGSTLVGRAVVTGSETPVVGAAIEAIQIEGGGSRESARTDADGKFRVEGLQPGRYRVEATSEGREGYSGSSLALGIGETSQEITIPMDPAFVVRGKVVDEHGAPCTAGEVTLNDAKQNEFSQGAIDTDGTVRMASVIPGVYKVEVSCTGRMAKDDFPVIAITDRDAPVQTWTIEAGSSVRVAIVSADGKMVTASDVSVYSTGGDSFGASSDRAEKDGSYLLAGLKPGPYQVSVNTTDGAQATEQVTVQARHEEQVKIQLPATGTIDGSVEDEEHHPLANLNVTVSGGRYATTRSLDDGTFSIGGLASGDYSVSVGDRVRRSTPDAKAAGASARVTVTAPEHAQVKLSLAKRTATISGRVVDGNGQPVTDAFLDYARSTPGSRVVPRNGANAHTPVVTDTEGRFTIEELVEGEYDLRASRKGGSETTVPHVAAGSQNITVRIADGASIAGILTSRKDGAPVERFTVSVRDVATGFRRQDLFFHSAGVFTLQDLPAATYQVLAESPEGAAWADVTVAEGEQKKGLTLEMTMRGIVEGRVVAAENGAPIAGIHIGFNGSAPTSVVTSESARGQVTGADGRFHIEGVLGGAWTLGASASEDGAMSFNAVNMSVQITASGGTTTLGDIKMDRVVVPSAAMETE